MLERMTTLRGHEVTVTTGDSPDWRRCQEALLGAGVPVPLQHRSEWLENLVDADHRYVCVRDASSGEWRCGFPVELTETRSLPGHTLARVTRFGYGRSREALSAALEGLSLWTGEEDRLLRTHVELFSPEEETRGFLAGEARRLGFTEVSSPRQYTRTVKVRVDCKEDEILHSFHSSCRRRIREPGKNDFSVTAVHDPRFADRMDQLFRETFARTGGDPPERDWVEHIRFARDHPDLYRIVGTFHPELPEPESLVAFVCGRHNGDHCVYADGASTRAIESNVSLSYAPMWELIRWSRQSGAEWFDMGGITGKAGTEDDPLAGISKFKRYFTEEVLEVGGEWRLVAADWRGRLSSLVSETAAAARRVVG